MGKSNQSHKLEQVISLVSVQDELRYLPEGHDVEQP